MAVVLQDHLSTFLKPSEMLPHPRHRCALASTPGPLPCHLVVGWLCPEGLCLVMLFFRQALRFWDLPGQRGPAQSPNSLEGGNHVF